jgi:hypothetical protein
MTFAHVFRKFEMELDASRYGRNLHGALKHCSITLLTEIHNSPEVEHLPWRDVFGPYFYDPHLTVMMNPVSA